MTPPHPIRLRAMGRTVRVRVGQTVPEAFARRLREAWADCLLPDAARPSPASGGRADDAASEEDVLIDLRAESEAPGAAEPDSRAEAAVLRVGSPAGWPRVEQAFTSLVTTRLLTLLSGGPHLLHAAALAAPTGEGAPPAGPAPAVVLVGPSGRGKTTAARALAEAGWGYVTDETAVIDPRSLELTPYPKPLSIIERPGAPKAQRAAGVLGLAPAPPRSRAAVLVLLERLGPDQEPEGPLPRVEPVPLAVGLQALAEQSSGLERMPEGPQLLARLVERTGGVRRVLYREARSLDPLLRALLSAPEATAQHPAWTWVPPEPPEGREDPETAGAPDAAPCAAQRWRRAPGTRAVDAEEAALVLRPGRSYVLTRAAADAWLLLASPGLDLPRLREALERRHGAAPPGALEQILATLAAEGLLVGPEPPEPAAPDSDPTDPGAPGPPAAPAAAPAPAAPDSPRPVTREEPIP